MNTLFVSVAFGLGALLSAGAYAAAPAGAIAQCKDGTYFTGTEHKGACKGHQGVKEWLDKDKAPATTATTTPAPATASTAAPAPAKTPAAAPAATPKPAPPPPSTATTPHKPPTPASQIAQKPGGGPGMVWVNASSKVYHCPGDEWYGKTKEGSYMTEAAAKAAGNHGDHGKECSSK
jgi:type IV secretory pathway VirB10-like protein